MTVFIFETQPHRPCRQPPHTYPSGDESAAASSTRIEGDVRGYAGTAAQQRHTAAAHFNHCVEAKLRLLKAERAVPLAARDTQELGKGCLPV